MGAPAGGLGGPGREVAGGGLRWRRRVDAGRCGDRAPRSGKRRWSRGRGRCGTGSDLAVAALPGAGLRVRSLDRCGGHQAANAGLTGVPHATVVSRSAMAAMAADGRQTMQRAGAQSLPKCLRSARFLEAMMGQQDGRACGSLVVPGKAVQRAERRGRFRSNMTE